MVEIDFNNVTEKSYESCSTELNSKSLVLLDFKPYDGPVTMQYLPNGGIQSVFDYNLIINTSRGFYSCKEVIYDGEKMSVETLSKKVPTLVNEVLPN